MATPRRRAVFNALANLPVFTKTQRAKMLRRAGVFAGPASEFEQGFRVAGTQPLRIGRDCYFGYNVFIDCEAPVIIGNGSGLGQGARIISSHHEILPLADRTLAPTDARPVVLGNEVSVGAGATILAGLHIGDRCVIGAGAVLTHDTEPGGVYIGVPARRVRELFDAAPPVSAPAHA